MVGGNSQQLEQVIREEIRGELNDDAEILVYGQGDALDVRVEFPELVDSLSESLDDRQVQEYSALGLTVSRR